MALPSSLTPIHSKDSAFLYRPESWEEVQRALLATNRIMKNIFGDVVAIPEALTNRIHEYLLTPMLNPHLGLASSGSFMLKTRRYFSSASICIYSFNVSKENVKIQYVRKSDTDTHVVRAGGKVQGKTQHWMSGDTPYDASNVVHPKYGLGGGGDEDKWTSDDARDYVRQIFDVSVSNEDELSIVSGKDADDFELDERISPVGKSMLREVPERILVLFNGAPRIRTLPHVGYFGHKIMLVGCFLGPDGECEALVLAERIRLSGGLDQLNPKRPPRAKELETLRADHGYARGRAFTVKHDKAYYDFCEEDVYFVEPGSWS